MKRKRSLPLSSFAAIPSGKQLERKEKCEMKGLIKTDSVIVILYFVKIYAGKELQEYLL